jgi:hypothetical protein
MNHMKITYVLIAAFVIATLPHAYAADPEDIAKYFTLDYNSYKCGNECHAYLHFDNPALTTQNIAGRIEVDVINRDKQYRVEPIELHIEYGERITLKNGSTAINWSRTPIIKGGGTTYLHLWTTDKDPYSSLDWDIRFNVSVGGKTVPWSARDTNGWALWDRSIFNTSATLAKSALGGAYSSAYDGNYGSYWQGVTLSSPYKTWNLIRLLNQSAFNVDGFTVTFYDSDYDADTSDYYGSNDDNPTFDTGTWTYLGSSTASGGVSAVNFSNSNTYKWYLNNMSTTSPWNPAIMEYVIYGEPNPATPANAVNATLVSPANGTYSFDDTPTTFGNVTSITGDWNVTLLVNDTTKSAAKTISATGLFNITSNTLTTGENTWKFHFVDNSNTSNTFDTIAWNMYTAGNTSTCSNPSRVCSFSSSSIALSSITGCST